MNPDDIFYGVLAGGCGRFGCRHAGQPQRGLFRLFLVLPTSARSVFFISCWARPFIALTNRGVRRRHHGAVPVCDHAAGRGKLPTRSRCADRWDHRSCSA